LGLRGVWRPITCTSRLTPPVGVVLRQRLWGTPPQIRCQRRPCGSAKKKKQSTSSAGSVARRSEGASTCEGTRGATLGELSRPELHLRVGPSNPRRREVPCTFVGRCIEATSNTSRTPSRLESTSKPRLSPASGILWPACLAPPAAQSPDGSRPAAAKADTYPHFWKKKLFYSWVLSPNCSVSSFPNAIALCMFMCFYADPSSAFTGSFSAVFSSKK